MSESKKIYAAINSILAKRPNIAKARTSQQGQVYKFRGIDDFYETFQPLLALSGVTLDSEILEYKREERQSKAGGTLFYTILRIRWKFIADDGSSVTNDTIGEAMDSGDKSANKAMSASLKYALTQRFLVPTNEDSDTENESPQVKHVSPKQDRPEQPRQQPKAPGIPDFANFNSSPRDKDGIAF